jgi:hypothetical protein
MIKSTRPACFPLRRGKPIGYKRVVDLRERMKICRKCKVEKPEGEFYKHTDSPDGLDRWCKVCRYADTRAREARGKEKMPWSTERAIRLLSDNGIPATVGYLVGKPRKDIVVYGYLSVEAKSAVPHRPGSYIFGLTKAQRVERCDYYVLICHDTERAFVVPGESELLHFGKALCLNALDPKWSCFENAYEQIKNRVIGDIQLGVPIESVRVHSGANYYQVNAVG